MLVVSTEGGIPSCFSTWVIFFPELQSIKGLSTIPSPKHTSSQWFQEACFYPSMRSPLQYPQGVYSSHSDDSWVVVNTLFTGEETGMNYKQWIQDLLFRKMQIINKNISSQKPNQLCGTVYSLQNNVQKPAASCKADCVSVLHSTISTDSRHGHALWQTQGCVVMHCWE